MYNIDYESKNYADSVKELESNGYVWVYSEKVVKKIKDTYDVNVTVASNGVYCVARQ